MRFLRIRLLNNEFHSIWQSQVEREWERCEWKNEPLVNWDDQLVAVEDFPVLHATEHSASSDCTRHESLSLLLPVPLLHWTCASTISIEYFGLFFCLLLHARKKSWEMSSYTPFFRDVYIIKSHLIISCEHESVAYNMSI